MSRRSHRLPRSLRLQVPSSATQQQHQQPVITSAVTNAVRHRKLTSLSLNTWICSCVASRWSSPAPSPSSASTHERLPPPLTVHTHQQHPHLRLRSGCSRRVRAGMRHFRMTRRLLRLLRTAYVSRERRARRRAAGVRTRTGAADGRREEQADGVSHTRERSDALRLHAHLHCRSTHETARDVRAARYVHVHTCAPAIGIPGCCRINPKV